MHTLSYSQLSSYLKDPQGWHRRYIARDDNRTFPALLEGTAYHKMVEDHLGGTPLESPETYLKRSIWSGQELDLGDKTFDEVFASMQANVDRGFGRFLDCLKTNQMPLDTCGIELEVPFEVQLGENTSIRGYIDGVSRGSDGTALIDWKLVGAWGDHHAYYIQALTYVMALTAMGEDVKVAYFFEVQKKAFKTDKAQVVNIVEFTEFPEEDLYALKELYKLAVKEIITKEVQYLPNIFGQYNSGKEAWEYWKQRCKKI